MGVLKTARTQILLRSAVECEQSDITFARGSGVRVREQINLACHAREAPHYELAGFFDDQFRHEERIRQVWKRVIETPMLVNLFEGWQVGFCVFANQHEGGD